MTTGNISIFTQPAVNSNVSTGKAEGKEEINLTGADMFSEFMDRSASMQAPDINADKQEAVSQPAKSESPEESYNKMQSGSHSNVREKEETSEKPDVKSPETKKIISGKTEKIKEAIKEELNVSDEDIEKMMEMLGFTDIDLFDQNSFVQLVTELTGAESAVDLLSMQGVNDLLDNVSLIKTELATELNVSAEGLEDALKLMKETSGDETFEIPLETVSQDVDIQMTDTVADAALQQETVASDSQNSVDTVTENPHTVIEDAAVADKVTVNTESPAKTVSNAADTGVTENITKETPEEKPEIPSEVETTGQKAEEGKSEDLFQGQTETGAKKETADNFADDAVRHTVHQAPDGSAHISADTHMQSFAADQEVQSYIDVDSLIDQFATLTKSLENDQTTLSMRLNPENLGQLTLHVTEKQGNLTAEVRVENEQVRDALNTQIAELRANLENAGVKVTAVEVTVESHEFESAYENQAGSAADGQEKRGDRPSEESAEASEKISGIRNINLNNPEEIADNLTEAEIVNASIMRDNGNSVDFKA